MKDIIEAINVQIKEEQKTQEKCFDISITLYKNSLKKEINLYQAKQLIIESMD